MLVYVTKVLICILVKNSMEKSYLKKLIEEQENVLEISVLCYTIKGKYTRLSKGGI